MVKNKSNNDFGTGASRSWKDLKKTVGEGVKYSENFFFFFEIWGKEELSPNRK